MYAISVYQDILQRENDARDPKPLNSAKIMYRACMNSRKIATLLTLKLNIHIHTL